MTIQTEVNAKIHAQSEILTQNTSVRDVKDSKLLMQHGKYHRTWHLLS